MEYRYRICPKAIAAAMIALFMVIGQGLMVSHFHDPTGRAHPLYSAGSASSQDCPICVLALHAPGSYPGRLNVFSATLPLTGVLLAVAAALSLAFLDSPHGRGPPR